MSMPFILHWYNGTVPPFTVAEVKVTCVPEHTVIADAEVVILTGSSGFTVIVRPFERAGEPEGHRLFEVTVQVTRSPFTAGYEKRAFVAPGALNPFTFHW
jgi:hypothetical protein